MAYPHMQKSVMTLFSLLEPRNPALPMSVCIQYSRPASGQSDSEIFGFDVAVANLMTAYFRHSSAQRFLCRPTDMPSFEHFKELATAAGIDAEQKCVGLNPHHPEKNLQSVGCMFRPDPLTVDLIWRRQQIRGAGYATCGLVHTMSGDRIARAVGNLCSAPSDETDALICPSHAIRDAVHALWETQCDYINHRYGGKFICPVQTPVIPLGIDTANFAQKTTSDKRAAQRGALGVAEDEIIILFVGRLSFATKAHPLPMFMAAERAAIRTGRKVRLVLYGYFKPLDMESHFRKLAADLCKTVTVEFVLNDDPRFPDGLWAAADIFTSLSDNVQESFGLTPIEAMACGLPAVISDWDGYREGVRNGCEGFLIPVVTPPPSAGMAIAQQYYNADNYGVALAATVQSTSVDIEWCAQSYAVLISNADLRRSFGDKGRIRAQTVFDWQHIIRAYDELWRDLSEKRQTKTSADALPPQWQAVHPAFPNPWHMFRSFPTTRLLPTDIVHIAMDEAQTAMVMSHSMNYFVQDLLLPDDSLCELIAIIRRAKSVRIQDILHAFPTDSHDLLWRCIGWMLKHGICAHERPPAI
jgi:glycosyltransferase involved in cell wall biosynthesis